MSSTFLPENFQKCFRFCICSTSLTSTWRLERGVPIWWGPLPLRSPAPASPHTRPILEPVPAQNGSLAPTLVRTVPRHREAGKNQGWMHKRMKEKEILSCKQDVLEEGERQDSAAFRMLSCLHLLPGNMLVLALTSLGVGLLPARLPHVAHKQGLYSNATVCKGPCSPSALSTPTWKDATLISQLIYSK